MRPKLLKSFVLVTVFWFMVTAVYWSFADPQVNLRSLMALKRLLPFLPVEVPKEAHILQSLSVQLVVLKYWTLPVLGLTAMSFLAGFSLVWLRAKQVNDRRQTALKTGEKYRGVSVTIGALPIPKQLPRDEVSLEDEADGPLSKASAAERRALEEIIGTLSAHPDAYHEPGTSGALQCALAAAYKALSSHKTQPGLAACSAAASELGKITAYKKVDGEWSLVKNEAREAAKILTSLPAWAALPPASREALMLSVKYRHSPRSMPIPEGDQDIFRLAQDLLYSAKDTQAEVVTQEKQKSLEKTLEQQDLAEVVFAAFKRALPLLAFQNRGLPKGVRAVAWKVGRRVYMLEIALRESVMAQMPPEIAKALMPAASGAKPRIQPFTTELLKALDGSGWLISKIDDKNVAPSEALWTVQAGKLEFRGVIIIDVPDEFLPNLPAQDSMYELTVTGVLFTSALRDERGPGLDKPNKAALAGVLDL